MTLGASSAAASVSAATDTISYYLDDVPMGPPDAILGIAQAFRTCTDERKVNVCVGAYRDEKGQPWVLPSVRAAELKMMQDGENKEYLPIEGDAQFIEKALQFAYGSGDDAAPLECLAAVQTLTVGRFWHGSSLPRPRFTFQ